jgi:3'(2'), 5'-bisphosphate nucleotidase
LNPILHKAIVAAIEAGKRILEIYQESDFEIETKIDDTPLTKADKISHIIISSHLADSYPILSEEGKSISYEERKDWNTFWLVDPLDGTKEFIKRNGEFTVNIALIEKGIPILGVILVPVSGELYYADKIGSFKYTINPGKDVNLKQIMNNSVQLPCCLPGEDFIVVGSRSHLNAETAEYVRIIDTNGRPSKMVTRGSSLKFCLVASGEADIYPRLGPTMEWDIAAGHAIARYAGRKVSQLNGEPLLYNKEDLLNPWFVVK